MRHALGLAAIALLWFAAPASAQTLTLPPDGDNQHSTVTQAIGLVTVTIDYHSPDVHAPDGTDRRGNIWGKLVPYGVTDDAFGTCTQCPWRAGANENTAFSVSHDVKIEGQALPAGSYGLHMIAGPEEWTLIFSKNAKSWGNFFYDPAEDQLRARSCGASPSTERVAVECRTGARLLRGGPLQGRAQVRPARTGAGSRRSERARARGSDQETRGQQGHERLTMHAGGSRGTVCARRSTPRLRWLRSGGASSPRCLTAAPARETQRPIPIRCEPPAGASSESRAS